MKYNLYNCQVIFVLTCMDIIKFGMLGIWHIPTPLWLLTPSARSDVFTIALFLAARYQATQARSCAHMPNFFKSLNLINLVRTRFLHFLHQSTIFGRLFQSSSDDITNMVLVDSKSQIWWFPFKMEKYSGHKVLPVRHNNDHFGIKCKRCSQQASKFQTGLLLG